MCPPGQEFDPREICSCVPGEKVLALYPEDPRWVPDYLQKYLPIETCQETDLLEVCGPGLDFNTDLCMCTSQIHCMLWCGEDSKLHPQQGCNCISNEEYDQVLEEGYKKWQRENEMKMVSDPDFTENERMQPI